MPPSSVVWLMRHAEARKVAGQSEDDLFSLGDLGLSERGRAQAEAARDALAMAREPLEAAYASPLARSQETARIVAAPHRLAVRTDARLAELPAGGSTYEEVLERILALPQRIDEHRARLDAFAAAMDEIAARHRCALVVAHGLSNRAFLARVRGVPLSEMLGIDQEHAQATRLERDAARGWRG